MPEFEHWADAYRRILSEVEAELFYASEAKQYAEYRRRCQQWKTERGVK